MNPADEMAPTERHLADAAADTGEKSDQQLRAILENLERARLRGNPVEQDDLRSGIAHRETSERKAIYSRLVAIEKEMKRRGRFARYLVAILIGVAATLAWQSYSDAAKQVIATRAPELGWSPEAKQMIASWTVGWTKPPASPEKVAPETVAPKAPPAASVDPAQVQQIAQSLAALRQSVEQIAAGQDQTSREMARVEAAVAELILKVPEPSAQPPAASEPKPVPVPPSSRAPTAPTPRH